MTVTDREFATILAALRMWQALAARHRSTPPYVADYFYQHKPLSPGEIDDLCERLNTEEA